MEKILPDGSVLLLSTDTDAMRRAYEATCVLHRASRREIRTPEMGELRATGRVADRLNTRGVDVVASWEQACHNRERRGTTDGSTSVLARLNHACDRLVTGWPERRPSAAARMRSGRGSRLTRL